LWNTDRDPVLEYIRIAKLGRGGRSEIIVFWSNHRSWIIEAIVDGLTHFTALDALEATLAGFLAQEAAAQGGDTTETRISHSFHY